MKAFRFRLESLLHLRGLTRERALKEYANAIHDRQLAEARCKELTDRLRQIEDMVADLRNEGISGHDQATFLASIEYAKDALAKQNEVLRLALEDEELKRSSYVEADVAEKTMLRLKERRQEEHLHEQAAKEERTLEDVIGSRYSVISPTEISHETA